MGKKGPQNGVHTSCKNAMANPSLHKGILKFSLSPQKLRILN